MRLGQKPVTRDSKKDTVTFRIREVTKEESTNETDLMFEKVKPYLDDGYTLYSALKIIMGRRPHSNARWYKDLREYCREQGYDVGKKYIKRYNGRKIKYYYSTSPYNKSFKIQRTINHRRITFGIVSGEGTAKAVVERLNQIEWDESQFDEIRKEFGV